MLQALELAPEELIPRAHQLALKGWRFVTMTCVQVDSGFEVLYHFDRELEMEHLRIRVSKDQVLPSITPVYFGAFLAENEAQDFFGLKFENLSVDYEGRFFLTADSPVHPMTRTPTPEHGEKGEGTRDR